MQRINFLTGVLSTTTSCANGILTMTTKNPKVPGSAMVKQLNGVTYLFAQSDRRSAAGARFVYTLAGVAGKTARVIYDSDGDYDPAHNSDTTTFTVDASGQFSDVIGAHKDQYQVKAYVIE